MEPAVDLNPGLTIERRIVGNERTPVLVLDEVLTSTDALRSYAARNAKFSSKDTQGYPGVRAPLPATYRSALLPKLRDIIADAYGLSDNAECTPVHELLSLVATAPEHLALLQRVPHFDNHSPFYFATVHYLSPEHHGGTGIFRHRPTGFESISESRYPLFASAAQAYVQSAGEPSLAYIRESDDHFELIEELEYRPNRMIIYPGYLLHSGLIEPDTDISADPESGRLTANLFLLFSK